ncbi:ABC transporter ATP-binding protein [Treponema primitia]|uniref:ATP-binding cassette domain-containing protein n=1 Tax=Treponema primitia TaxID=88058 RepID=UPI0002E5D3C2|nr:ABC transporter ATP-binding protein [Treponema primitia]
MSETVILEVKQLSAVLKETQTPLIRGISFSIREGEVLGLLGESGSGKSLSSLAIAGLLPETIQAAGSVLLMGREIIGADEASLVKIRGRDVAIVFQEPTAALDPLMRIGRQIALPLKKNAFLRGERPGPAGLDKAVFALMEEVKLTDIKRIARSFPHEISGGQRQRAAIALALACSPKLLIADEPTSAIDASIQKQLVDLIYDVAVKRGIAVLFISHDVAVVHKIAHRIIVMKDGLIVEENTGDGIVNKPQNEYTRLLIKSARRLDLAAPSPLLSGETDQAPAAKAGV